jgi:hypothetical protein
MASVWRPSSWQSMVGGPTSCHGASLLRVGGVPFGGDPGVDEGGGWEMVDGAVHELHDGDRGGVMPGDGAMGCAAAKAVSRPVAIAACSAVTIAV